MTNRCITFEIVIKINFVVMINLVLNVTDISVLLILAPVMLYADDTVILAETADGLQNALNIYAL